MVRSEKFGFRLSPSERALLALLSEREKRTSADVLRLLIRRAANEDSLVPEKCYERLPKSGKGDADA